MQYRKVFANAVVGEARIPPALAVGSVNVPLDDKYSFDYGTETAGSDNKVPISADKVPISADKVPINNLTVQQSIIFQFIKEKGKITSHQAEELLGVKQRRARSILGELVKMGILERQGTYKNTKYVLNDGKKN